MTTPTPEPVPAGHCPACASPLRPCPVGAQCTAPRRARTWTVQVESDGAAEAASWLDMDPLDPATPEYVVDAQLRAEGIDPVELGKRGTEFVAGLIAAPTHDAAAELERAADAVRDDCSCSFGEEVTALQRTERDLRARAAAIRGGAQTVACGECERELRGAVERLAQLAIEHDNAIETLGSQLRALRGGGEP